MVDRAGDSERGSARRERLATAARRRPIAVMMAVTAALSLLLFLLPGLDLWITGLFHGGAGAVQFPASEIGFLRDLRDLGITTTRLLVVVVVVSLLGPFLLSGQRVLLRPRAAVFLALGLVLGPGLLVNTILKGLWGRARPVQVIDFGGEHPFTAPWVVAGYCDSNCSFVSGEASASMFLVAIALVVPRSWRLPVALGAGLFAVVMSLNRIAFGGHFFSDVVIAWALTLLVVLIVHRLVYGPTSRLTDERIASALAAAGDRAKAAVGWLASTVIERTAHFLRLFR